MKFTPKTEKEINEANLLPAAFYDFTVSEAEEQVSKSQNEMIVLKLDVYGPEGSIKRITDYLANTDKGQFKIRHFCDSVGLMQDYDAGTLTAEICIQRSGKCKVSIQPEDDKYPAKNIIRDYANADKGVQETKQAKLPTKEEDDNLPF